MTAPEKKKLEALPLMDDSDIAPTMKKHGIPNIGRAVKAANQQEPRPHRLHCKLTDNSRAALERFVFEKKMNEDRGYTMELAIAQGLKALGIEIDPADLMPDRRRD